MININVFVGIVALDLMLCAGVLPAMEPETFRVTEGDVAQEKTYSPYANRAYPDEVLFGDTHVHTKLSADAGLIGTTLTVSDAYRFARGETITTNTGQQVQLVRPLDFLAITDHSDYIGLAPMIRDADPYLLGTEYGAWLHERFLSGPDGAMEAFRSVISDITSGNARFDSPQSVRRIWEDYVQTSEAFNEPGSFTAMTGFEFTSFPDGNNLHRVVVFRDDDDKTGQILPYSIFDSENPEDLWKYMENYESTTGGHALAIPHNGNLSNGLMFPETDFNGNPITQAYAEARMRWEPIIEVTQIKGDGEAHPLLSPEDEFADYENWDVANIDGTAAKEEWMLQYEYGRSALKLGL